MKCISYICTSSGEQIECWRKTARTDYPFCKVHIKRRLTKEQIQDLEDPNLVCSEILVSGKNKDKCCSKYSFRGCMCLNHLRIRLTTCYIKNCDNLSFYNNGLCSIHCGIGELTSEFVCPCPKHDVFNFKERIKKKEIPYYCNKHNSEECSCLLDYFTKCKNIDVILPDEIIDQIFSHVEYKGIYTIRCVSKYYHQYDYNKNILEDIKNLSNSVTPNPITDNNKETLTETSTKETEYYKLISKSFKIAGSVVLPDNLIEFSCKQLYKNLALTILNNYNYLDNHNYVDIEVLGDFSVIGLTQNIYNQINNNVDVIYNFHNLDFIYNSSKYHIDLISFKIENENKIRQYLHMLFVFYNLIVSNLEKIKNMKLFSQKSFNKISKSLISEKKCYQHYSYFDNLHNYLKT